MDDVKYSFETELMLVSQEIQDSVVEHCITRISVAVFNAVRGKVKYQSIGNWGIDQNQCALLLLYLPPLS